MITIGIKGSMVMFVCMGRGVLDDPRSVIPRKHVGAHFAGHA